MSFARRPRRGFVLGKFLPPHNGHVFLCEFGRHYCERLTILVCSIAAEPIPGELRFRWMRELFPDCDVQWCAEELPQEPKDHPDFWPIWREVTLRYAGGAPDVVFASEPYGLPLAEVVGARFVPVDIARRTAPVSGTAVRADPFAQWAFLPAPVRAHFVKRVCLFGPESTGKSSLAAALAQRFRTVAVPEYGRTHTDVFGVEVDRAGIEAIVAGHLASVAAARRQANRILIEDTDPLMSAVWSDRLTGGRDPWFASYTDTADLYLLCDIDLPWVDDGTRYFPGSEDRRAFFEACQAELAARRVPYAVVRGAEPAARLEGAVAAILAAFPALHDSGP